MIGIEIDKRDKFRQQSVPTISQIEGKEIETAHKSAVSPYFPIFPTKHTFEMICFYMSGWASL